MIAIVSSNVRECGAFATVCDSRGWANISCGSLRAFRATLTLVQPWVVLTRQRLEDGYSDDVLSALKTASNTVRTKAIVLMPAGSPSSHHARQVALGADCVLHDPVAIDVLVEYLTRYLSRTAGVAKPGPNALRMIRFAGATIHPLDRTLRHRRKTVMLTPRELELVRILTEAANQVVTYQTLYSEMLGRRFDGDSANVRVLLGRLEASLRRVGVRLRRHVEVIAKTGYRYNEPGQHTSVDRREANTAPSSAR